ncbi:MAG: SUMF1/EgtB/PvdO family nonheme iron enzyme [Planctomycetota bacterium]
MKSIRSTPCVFAGLITLSAVFCIDAGAKEPVKVQPGIAIEQPAEGPFVKVAEGFMVPYKLLLPGSDVEVSMIPVPGGKFKMGSSKDSAGHAEDEGPQIELQIDPMWVAKCETTWEEYKYYMSMYQVFKKIQEDGSRAVTEANMSDAVTAPTELYEPTHTYEYGEGPKLPAVTITQYAAKQYTKWLSKITGQQYRLPTEAEWEYACRGGSDTAYHFGDDPAKLGDYAWYAENSEDLPHDVGLKKPNQYGLYDMHGNAIEWVIDAYTKDGYGAVAKKGPKSYLEAIQWPPTQESRALRGGGFQDDPEVLRSAARIGSEDEDWKDWDPNIPLSPWWYTTDPARAVGFRIFRSYKPIDEKLISKFWDIDNEDIQFDVDVRIEGGRGVLIPVDPAIVEEIKASK